MTTDFRKRDLLLLAFLVVPALTACVSEMPRFPTEPGPIAFQPAFTDVSVRAKGSATSNRFKYRDAGRKPGRGQSGGAVMEARALLGKDGMTLVEAVVGAFDEGMLMGRLEKVQLKLPSVGGSVYNDKPQARSWSRQVRGLTSMDSVQVHGNVRLSSGTGMHVVLLTVPVSMRPDLQVSDVSAPAQAFLNTPVTIVATVRERNGDVGARGDCLLTIDGAAVDQARAIWVDALDAVNCQFSYMFRTVGTHNISVSVKAVNPGDFDLTNNSATTAINIVPPGALITFGSVQAQEEAYSFTVTQTRTGTYPITGAYQGSQMLSGISFYGTTVDVANEVTRVESKLSVDGAVVHESELTEFSGYEYDDGFALVRCREYFMNGEQAQSCVSMHHAGNSSAWFFYAHTSGTVTYYGQTLYCHTSGCDTYTQNRNTVTGTGSLYGIAPSSIMRIELTFVDAADESHVVDRNVAFEDQSASENYDRTTCMPYFDGLGDWCVRRVSQGTVFRGLVTWDESQAGLRAALRR